MKLICLAAALWLVQNPEPPALSLRNATAKVTVKGAGLDGTYTFDRVGSMAAWGPLSGGLLVIQNDKDDTFQYAAAGKAGTYKTSVGAPLVVQLGKGPKVKVVKSAAAECSVTVAKADESGVSGTFACGKVAVTASGGTRAGVVEAVSGSFSASR